MWKSEYANNFGIKEIHLESYQLFGIMGREISSPIIYNVYFKSETMFMTH